MKKILGIKSKYKNIVFILSVIVAIVTIKIFTFPALTAGPCDPYGCVTTKDTGSLITMNLYDYGTNINTEYSKNNKLPGFHQSYGITEPDPFTAENFLYNLQTNINAYHYGDVITSDLGAGGIGEHYGTINDENISSSLSGRMYDTLINGYPALSDKTSLKYLFNSTEGYAIKQNTNNISHLFQYNESTNEYFYSSRNNHAEFIPNEDIFRVYNAKITPNAFVFPFGNFLPLNKINNETTQSSLLGNDSVSKMHERACALANSGSLIEQVQYTKLCNNLGVFNTFMTAYFGNNYASSVIDFALPLHPELNITDRTPFTSASNLNNLYTIDFDKKTNYFFGFEMKFNFMQPKNGEVGSNKQDMVFRFEGDDDVWVYIDDVLFLDLSGIHAQVGGEIDFKNGIVRYYGFDNETYAVKKDISKSETFAQILARANVSNKLNDKGTFDDYSTHKLNFYYMERGSSSSVMTTKFNMPLTDKHAITIAKEVSTEDSGAIGNKEYYFQIIKPDGNQFINDTGIFNYEVYDKNNNKLRTSTTDATGIIKLFEGERAVVSGIDETKGEYYVRELLDNDYENVLVDGIDKLSSDNLSIEINGKEYTIVSSDKKDISNGGGIITFENNIKVGQLKIKKLLASGSESLKNTTFKFLVKINNEPLKLGTPYKIGTKDYTVQTAGIIELKPDEEAIIEKIMASSNFSVVEDLSSINNSFITVNYQINGTDTKEEKATGVISAENINSVIVTNADNSGTYIEIPIKKMTTNPDGVKNTYEFTLIDADKKENIATESITVDENGIGNVTFKVEYSKLAHPNKETIYNYQIKEVIKTDDNYTLYDTSTYDIKATVINDTTFTATYTVSKNGESIDKDDIIFNNQRLSSLTIKKTVKSDNPNNGQKFNFNIESSSSVDGIYPSSAGNITFTKGKAAVTLSHNESITVHLPYGLNYNITEINKDGYNTTYKVDSSGEIDGDSVTIEKLSKDTVIEFTNIKGYELPKTGSSGMLLITTIGTILISMSFVYLLKKTII